MPCAAQSADQLQPDIVVLDIGMPLLNGLDAARELKKKRPSIKLIFLTMETDSYIAAEAFPRRRCSLSPQNVTAGRVTAGRSRRCEGNLIRDPQIGRAIENMFIRDPRAEAPSSSLAAQREVLQMLAEGRSMKEIAYVLEIAHRTVRFHKYQIMEELGISVLNQIWLFADAQLLHDLVLVKANGTVGNLQNIGDFFHGTALGKHLQDFALAASELLGCLRLGSRINMFSIARPICGSRMRFPSQRRERPAVTRRP